MYGCPFTAREENVCGCAQSALQIDGRGLVKKARRAYHVLIKKANILHC